MMPGKQPAFKICEIPSFLSDSTHIENQKNIDELIKQKYTYANSTIEGKSFKPFKYGSFNSPDGIGNLLEASMMILNFHAKRSLDTDVIFPEFIKQQPNEVQEMHSVINEILFEEFNASSIMYTNTPFLSLISEGMDKGSVLELGQSHSLYTIIKQGATSYQHTSFFKINGRKIDRQLFNILNCYNYNLSRNAIIDSTANRYVISSLKNNADISTDLWRVNSSLPDGSSIQYNKELLRQPMFLYFDTYNSTFLEKKMFANYENEKSRLQRHIGSVMYSDDPIKEDDKIEGLRSLSQEILESKQRHNRLNIMEFIVKAIINYSKQADIDFTSLNEILMTGGMSQYIYSEIEHRKVEEGGVLGSISFKKQKWTTQGSCLNNYFGATVLNNLSSWKEKATTKKSYEEFGK
jgi:actin-related protein